MQTNLNCLNHNCSFNKSFQCYASHIKIEGFEASITPETYCDTFKDNTSFNLSNYSGEISLTNSQNISCCANNCKYNISGGCASSYVEINLENASCETFVLK
ncbi:DUF1540 domain-containing protein [Romboutsia sedimentorum]|uniref:DUF1540 domain-containing protein n=1 Tax=Romboutsia sedimentorum TaxID=1368474 RepID=A0ABT7E9V7_9FIRM|nr:DUF1540 domain-containing protein [Romboutsia sedimentorum]MDK2563467.1 DUF1540 domain-containing protein [Romboutsia sedimentorum]MDK2585192.1 DUF1540 domain-containing protein [Romboutsia sedimentorum]